MLRSFISMVDMSTSFDRVQIACNIMCAGFKMTDNGLTFWLSHDWCAAVCVRVH